MSQLPILIIGGGLGGLTLAQSLKQQRIPFKVFERDQSISQRSQGYRIRIRDEGLEALKFCIAPSLYAEFERTSAENCPPGGRADAITGERIGGLMSGPNAGNPSMQAPTITSLPIDRRVMRGVLLEGIEDSVEYNKSFAKYTSQSDKVIASFSDGTTVEGSFLVGADGIKSQVAHQLSNGQSEVLDMNTPMIYGKSLITPSLEEKLLPMLRKGMSSVWDQSGDHLVTLFLEPMRFRGSSETPDYIFWVLSGSEGLAGNNAKQVLGMDREAVVKLSLEVTNHWNPQIKALLEAQDETQTAALRLTTSDPRGLPTWKTNPRVTVLGDSIHCMPPTGGSGANTALRDAMLLAKMFEKEVGLEDVTTYEEQMRSWANKVVKMSCQAAVHGFGVKPLPQMQ